MDTPLNERREILEKNVKRVEDRVEYSDLKKPKSRAEVAQLIVDAIKDNLEGLVVKDSKGKYEPAARHWGKIKKDYLQLGMADSADLIVLGGYFGTGKMAGKIASFLMGVYDKSSKTFKTVTKVANGFDDECIDNLQRSLVPKMKDIKGNYDLLPKWIVVNRIHVPDYIAVDPKKMPVWEVTGTEYLESVHHTADAISIRFPRMTHMRDDKDWETATSLEELQALRDESKKKTADPESLLKGGGLATELKKKKDATSKPATKKAKLETPNPTQPEPKKAPVDIEEEYKPNEKPLSSSEMQFFHSIVGDIRSPHGSGTKVILNICDNTGKWPKKGLFQAISSKWPQPEKEFKACALGDVIRTQVEDNIWIANLIVMQPDHSGYNREFFPAHFRKAIFSLNDFVVPKNASVHIMNQSSIKFKHLSWSQIKKDLAMYLPAIHVYHYVFGKDQSESEKEISKPTNSHGSAALMVQDPKVSSTKKNNSTSGSLKAEDHDATQVMEWSGEDSVATDEVQGEDLFLIPPLFDNLTFFFYNEAEFENVTDLKHYVVVFSGTITQDPSQANLILCPQPTQWQTVFDEWIYQNHQLSIVTEFWAWNSINQTVCLPRKKYMLPRN